VPRDIEEYLASLDQLEVMDESGVPTTQEKTMKAETKAQLDQYLKEFDARTDHGRRVSGEEGRTHELILSLLREADEHEHAKAAATRAPEPGEMKPLGHDLAGKAERAGDYDRQLGPDEAKKS
jgi:hypothetical protein